MWLSSKPEIRRSSSQNWQTIAVVRSMNGEQAKQTVTALLAGSRLADSAIDDLAAMAGSRDYWKRLCPALSVEGPEVTCDAEIACYATLTAQLARHGYFHSDSTFPLPFIERLRD